ncbi:MAG TPA: arylamine N-acetyltransferase [Acidimicrobiia bacterium]|nr:arylamine N-acetyltransferase [Acidimicrobiia bacterium]
MAGFRTGLVSTADVDAYLRRLDLDPEPPSAAGLARLHRAQVERVPYETIWIHLGQQWGIDPVDSFRRVAHDRRGGYCYHLNGAFFELLGALGYRVSRHIGGVHGPEGPSTDALTNHLVLVVEGLPTDSNPGGRWYVDAGLGDALYEPMPMVAGEYEQATMRFGLKETNDGVGHWHLAHDPTGSFTGMSFRLGAVSIDAFSERHAYLSTSPQSGFVRVLTAQRRHATGVDSLRGLVLTRVDGEQRVERVIDRPREWLDVIADLFGLRLDVPPAALESLWAKVMAAHEARLLSTGG